MNEFWLMQSILSFIAFIIFIFLPSTEQIVVERTFDPEGDGIEDVTIVSIWIIRVISFIIAVVSLLLYIL